MYRPRQPATATRWLLPGALMMLTACVVAAPQGRVRLSAASLPWDAEARTLQAAANAGQERPPERIEAIFSLRGDRSAGLLR
jgi:hypothetical protein